MSQPQEFRLPLVARPERYEIELSVDLEEESFRGVETVELTVVAPTRELELNSLELAIPAARLEGHDGRSLLGEVSLDDSAQRARIAFGEEIRPGTGYRLHLEFSGSLDQQLRGFYRSTFRDEAGEIQMIASTQFEATDARRAFPCWDEPEFKAVFAVSLVVPEHLTALSNGPEISSEPAGAGRRRVRFADTMRMSTYLVAFVIGPFELTPAVVVHGVPIRVAYVPRKAHLSTFALEAAAHSLRFLAGYFDIPYPAEKLDHVAIPDFSFGAMENLGCVTYRENSLLVDPGRASQLELQRVATVIAHETAHMWFGDLVTMKWWNGIWLNEAFATFMELMTTDDFNPSWQVWNGFSAARAAAVVTDGLRSTRPVEFSVHRPEEAEAMFDVLTYQKGGAVLRMLEQHLGPETFRKGITHYLRTHAYGNSETTDLWDALETASGQPVREIMGSWIAQGGLPVVRVDEGDDPSTLKLTQRRFLYDATPSPESWVVPIGLRASVGGKLQRQRVLLSSSEDTVSFDGPVEWVVANDGADGFYRVRYSTQLIRSLLATELTERLAPLERFDLVSDSWSAVVAGSAGLEEWVAVARVLAGDEDPDVWGALSGIITFLRSVARGDDVTALRAFAAELTGPIWDRLGWESHEGEDRRLQITRARVLSARGLVGEDLSIREEASARFERFTAEGTGLEPDTVAVAARLVVAFGGEDQWSAVAEQYRLNVNPQEKLRYLYALAEAPDETLVARTLDFAGSDEVRLQDAPFLMASVLAHPRASGVAWPWIAERWESLLKRYPAGLLLRMFEALQYVSDETVARGVREFCASHDLPLSGPRLDQILERLDINVAVTDRLRGRLTSALRSP